MGIRIDELPEEFFPSAEHVLPVMKDEVTTRMSVDQIIELARAVIVAQILGGAPAQLDTLDELAAALADDANFAATITAALALKAPLASPALTGNPTVPGQVLGNDSTRIANTAFVQAMRTALLTDAVTFANKNLNSTNTFDRGTIALKQSSNPTPTAEGDIQWDTDDDYLQIGNGTVTKIFKPNLREYLGDYSGTAVAAIPVTGLGAYRTLYLTGMLMPTTDNETIAMQMGAGGVADTGASNYNNQTTQFFGTTTSTANADTFGARIANGVGNASPEGAYFETIIHDFNQAKNAVVTTRTTFFDGATTIVSAIHSVRHKSTAARDMLRFLPNAGNITGSFKLEGIKG